MHRFRTCVAALGVGLLVAGCTATIENVYDEPYAAPMTVTLDDIQQEIIRVAALRGWTVEPVELGRIRAEYAPRTHVAVVEISFDEDSFSITYVDSTNLDYNGDRIHQNYNRWVNNLKEEIKAALPALQT